MNIDPQNSLLPAWAIDALEWLVYILVGILGTVGFWLYRTLHWRIFRIESTREKLASVDQVTALEIRIQGLASRKELASCMAQIRADIQDRDDRLYDELKRMHLENKEAISTVRNDMKETRDDVRSIHQRID